jgi:hypothetical protein
VTANVPPLSVVPALFWTYSGRFVPAAHGSCDVVIRIVHVDPPPGVSASVVGLVFVGNWILSPEHVAAPLVVTVSVVLFFSDVLFLFWRVSGKAGLATRFVIPQAP